MIEDGEHVVLIGNDREYFVQAGKGNLSTDLGVISLSSLVGTNPGDKVTSHLGHEFSIYFPRSTDFFTHASRSGAPMLPKDIGLVIGLTGMNHRDMVLDAGTGSGIAAIYFGGIAQHVTTFEKRSDFVKIAQDNVKAAKLDNVEIIEGDVLFSRGMFDVVHFDMTIGSVHIEHAYSVLRPGGYLACYTPFLEQTFTVVDAASPLFRNVNTYECIARELTRSSRGTRPSTRLCHSGYITIARR